MEAGARAARWREATAPDLEDLDALASEAFERLPVAISERLREASILVVDFADDETLDELEIEDPFELLGSYEGDDLAHRSSAGVVTAPTRILLYRRAILDYWAEHDETLGHLVAHVLIHEIGHHLGLSDDDMAAIEAGVRQDASRV